MKYRLEELAEVYDSLHQTPIYIKDGIPMVRVTDLGEGYLNLSKTLKVSEEVYNEFTKKYIPRKNDIIMSRVGTYGVCTLVNTEEKFCLGQNTVIISPKENKKFLYYYLISGNVREQIESFVTGSTQKTISLKNIRNIIVDLPNEKQQEKISNILDNIDKKIELNSKINDNLLKLGLSMISNLVYTELITLKEQADIISKGTTPTGKDMNTYSNRDIKFVKVKDFDEFGVNETNLEYIPVEIHKGKLKRSILMKDDLLVSIAGTLGKIGIVSETLDNANTNQAVAFIRLKRNINKGFLYFYMRTECFQEEIIKRKVHAVQPNLSLTELGNIKVPNLNENDCKVYNMLLAKILANNKQNEILTQLRDTLLPRLMNGEIDLDKIEI